MTTFGSAQGKRNAVDRAAKKLRVKIVSRIHLPEAAAASFRIDYLEKGLLQAGERIHVITAKPPVQALALASAQTAPAATSYVPVLRDKDGYVKGYLSYLSFDLQAFLRVLFGPKADAIVVEPPPTTGFLMRFAAGIRRTPYIWYAADVWSDATAATGVNPLVVRAVRFFEQTTLKHAAGVIAVSDGVAQRVLELGAKNVEVIPNGADTETFNLAAGATTPVDIFDGEANPIVKPYFIYAGTASQWQGAETLARGFAEFWREHPDYQCVFLARGDSLPEIRALADALATEAQERGLEYAPLIVHDLVPPVVAASWQAHARAALVSIVPGQGYDFAYPTKIFTALACGTPVLYAGPGPAVADITANDLGEAVAYSEAAVADGLLRLTQMPLALTERSRYSEWVQRFHSMAETGRRAAAFVQRCAWARK